MNKKYSTRLYKIEVKEIEVEAASPAEALQKARLENPGWSTNYVHDVETEEDFDLVAACEYCEALIFNEDYKVFMDENDEIFEVCKNCQDKVLAIKNHE